MQTLDSFLNMTNSNYIPNVIKPDIVFNLSNGIGSDIIYLPESGNLSDFFFSQKLNNMVRTEQIIIPPRMLLSGETIINTKYYEDLRKNLKGFVYSKIVTKLKDKKRSRYFDTTPLVGKMVSISNKKTVLNVYNEFFQKVFSIYTDFDNSIENKDKTNSVNTDKKDSINGEKPEGSDLRNQELEKLQTRPKILLIDVNVKDKTMFNGFTSNFEYYLQIQGYKVKLKIPRNNYPDFIIYKIDGKYYPVARYNPKVEGLLINKPMFMRVTKMIEDLQQGKDISEEKEDTSIKLLGFKNPKKIDSILNVGNELKTIMDMKISDKEQAKRLKEYIENNPNFEDLEGTDYKSRLENLQLATKHAIKLSTNKSLLNTTKNALNKNSDINEKEVLQVEADSIKKEDIQITKEEKTKIDKLDEAHKKLLKEHNGTIFLEQMQNRSTFPKMAFNPDNIVGLKEFSGYDKQNQEFKANLDLAIKDLVMSLEKDKDLKIKVHKIDSKIKDDTKTRYKLFTVQISQDYGATHKGKYSFNIEVPYPIEGKYIKYGGNDYLMVNQLFNQPIQKVNNNLARLYTHYNTTSVSLKNSKIGLSSLPHIFKEVSINLKNLNPKLKTTIKTTEISDTTKDNLPIDPSRKNFSFEKIEIDSPNEKLVIDLTVFNKDNEDIYLYKRINKSIINEGEEYLPDEVHKEHAFCKGDQIIYFKDGDKREFPLEHLDEFLLGIINNVSKRMLGTDALKKSKSSVPFFDARIIGKNIPVIVLMVSELGFTTAMNKIKVKFTVQEKKIINDEDSDIINIPILREGKRSYITCYPKTLKQKFLCNGLLKFKISNVEFQNPNDNSLFDGALAKDMGEIGFYKLKESINKIIDNTTEKILREKGYPTDVLDIYSDTIPNLLLSREGSHFEDLKYYRIRMSESISHIGYNQIQRAISELKRKKNFPGEKLFIKPDFIMKNLLEAGILQQSKTINPLEELMLSQKIIKTGIGNVKKSQVTLARRDLNKSYFGVISPTATNEYGGIGANQTLTNGTTILDRFGSIQTKKYNNNDNPFNMLSPVESCTTFMENTDTTRRVMGNQQTGQFTQLENPDEPLVQTGFESYIPYLVSSRFSKKAKIDGKIDINDNILTITGSGKDQGKIQKVPLRFSKSRTKRGVYLMNKYVLLVNSGQNVKEGTVLACTSSLKSGKLAIGKNLVVAEMGYNGKNYEDGWAVSTEMTKKYTNYYLQKITIKVPENVKIQEMELTKGKTTKAGDLLMSFIKSKYVENAIETDDDLNDEDDDTMYGLEQHGANSKYYSPGGVIEEIVVRLNSNKVDQKLKLLHQESIKDLNKLLGSCELLAKNHPGTKQEKEEIYQECMGNTDNISSLKIGGHKINGEEPGWAIIEVYIKRENNIGNGSKFTLGNSGGKGTVQYIIPEGKTPVTMETHMQVDFFATSLSIVKRKNTDIYFNMYLGKCIYFLNEMLKELNKKGTPVPKMKDFVLSAIKFIDKTEEKIIVKEYEQFFTQNSPEQVKKWINASHSLNRPLIVGIKPPFMNRITMRDIVELARYLHVPLKEKIMIPENDDTFTMRKVPVGILNVYFLEHFPQMQGSMRGSQYVKNSIITGQGSAGAKDRKGATKTGLYDLYSLLSKTPYNLIKELHTLKSDARQAKHAYQRQIFQTGELPSIKDIKITRVDTTTKNYIETLLLGAGLKSWY